MKHKQILSNEEIAAFCQQMGFIVKGGVSLQEGLLILTEDTRDGGREIARQLLEFMEAGGSFAQALKDCGYFPAYMVQMVEIGETSGRLEEVLDSLCIYYERNEAISRNIRGSIAYPLVMIVMMLAVILIIIIEVLPVFQQVFHQLGAEMSEFVQGILYFGSAVSQYSAWIIGALVVLVIAFLILRASQKGKRFLSQAYERLFPKLSATIDSAHFASAMALMLSSGMDVDQAISMAGGLVKGVRIKKKIQQAQQLLEQGESFTEALVQTGLFPGLYGKMIAVGFKTGTLDTVIQKIAQSCEEKADRRINTLVSILEPVLVAILSFIVGLILLSVMLPLMGIMSAIG